MSKEWHGNRHSYCSICSAKIPKRVTYLYEKELGAWICKECWNNKYDKSKAVKPIVSE